MVYQLTENYVPKIFPHRDEQIKKIRDTFDKFKKYNYGGNLLILGTTGSGKTSVIKKIISEQQNHNVYTIAIQDNTATKIFKRITGINTINVSTGELVEKMIKQLKEEPKVIIIDEVDKVKDFVNLMNHLNEVYRETTIPIILITNKRTIIDNIPADAKTTLILQKVEFPAYNPVQLKDIVDSRLKLITELNLPEMPEGTLNYICARAVRDGEHSARIALDLTLKCLLENNFNQDFVDKLIYDINEEDWNNFIHQLSGTQKDFLRIIIELSDGKPEITSSDIHSQMSNLSPSRISQLVTWFIEYGVLKYHYKNLGRRHGRYRALKFSSDAIKNKLICLLYPWMNEEECKNEQEQCLQTK